MDGAYRSGDRIVEQEDAAVGGKDHQGQLRFIGDEGIGGVAPLPPQPFARVVGGADPDGSLVDLLAEDHSFFIQPHSAAEAAVILRHRGGVIASAGPQVQTVPGRDRHTTLSGGEGMTDAG